MRVEGKKERKEQPSQQREQHRHRWRGVGEKHVGLGIQEKMEAVMLRDKHRNVGS